MQCADPGPTSWSPATACRGTVHLVALVVFHVVHTAIHCGGDSENRKDGWLNKFCSIRLVLHGWAVRDLKWLWEEPRGLMKLVPRYHISRSKTGYTSETAMSYGSPPAQHPCAPFNPEVPKTIESDASATIRLAHSAANWLAYPSHPR